MALDLPDPAAGIALLGLAAGNQHQGAREGLQGHFGRVVIGGLAVVVIGNAPVVADPLEAMGHAREAAEGRLHRGAGEAQLQAHGGGEDQVLAVVGSGHGQGPGIEQGTRG